MPLYILFYVKQFLTFSSEDAGKFSIMQFEHLSIEYSKKINFRLKRDKQLKSNVLPGLPDGKS